MVFLCWREYIGCPRLAALQLTVLLALLCARQLQCSYAGLVKGYKESQRAGFCGAAPLFNRTPDSVELHNRS